MLAVSTFVILDVLVNNLLLRCSACFSSFDFFGSSVIRMFDIDYSISFLIFGHIKNMEGKSSTQSVRLFTPMLAN